MPIGVVQVVNGWVTVEKSEDGLVSTTRVHSNTGEEMLTMRVNGQTRHWDIAPPHNELMGAIDDMLIDGTREWLDADARVTFAAMSREEQLRVATVAQRLR